MSFFSSAIRKLLGKTIEPNPPNILAALGIASFMDPKDFKELKKLKLSKVDGYKVSMGLIALGMFLVFEAIKRSVYRIVSNTGKASNIIQQFSNDIQASFIQLMLDEHRTPQGILTESLESIINPVIKDLGNYVQNPKKEFPGNTWGIFSIVLWRALGEQKAREIIENNLYDSKGFAYLKVQTYFDTIFMRSMESFLSQGGDIANKIDNLVKKQLENNST